MPLTGYILNQVATLEAIDREGYKPLKLKSSRITKEWKKQYRPNLWHAELVGVVQGYPGSPEEWKRRKQQAKDLYAARKASGKGPPPRLGVPDGFAGLRQAVEDARAWRKLEANKIVKLMEEKDLIEYPDPSQFEAVEDHEAAKGALALLISVVRSDTYKPRERLEAARTVLTFTKAKPVQKIENTLKSAEDFLSVLAGEFKMPTE